MWGAAGRKIKLGMFLFFRRVASSFMLKWEKCLFDSSGPKAVESGISFWRKQKFVASWSPYVTITKKGLKVVLLQHSETKDSRLMEVRFLLGSWYCVNEVENSCEANFCFLAWLQNGWGVL